MRRTIWLYRRYLGAQVRAVLQYEADFWMLIFAAALTQAVGFIFLDAIFRRIPELKGWTFWDVVLIYAMVSIGEGFVSLFFEGMWQLPRLVNEGELDYVLVRPFAVPAQIMGSAVGFNGLGALVTGVALFVVALRNSSAEFSATTAVLGVILLASSLTIRVAIGFASNVASFWIAGPTPVVGFAVHQIGELSRYPITIFSWSIRVAVGIAVPFAFASVIPVDFLFNDGPAWLGLLPPVVAVYCVFMARWLFRRGLSRYESAGN